MDNTQWLRKEAEKWVEDGLISAEQQEVILAKYPLNKASNSLLIIFALIGSLLIGAGIILVFATNWWKLPTTLKVCIAFAPLLVAQGICIYTYFKKFDSISFREGGCIFLSLSFFASLALIGQVFHTSSQLGSYVLICILFILPGIYFFRSKFTMAIYIIGAIYVSWFWPAWVAFLLLILCLPFAYFVLVFSPRKEVINYQLFLLVAIVSNFIIVAMKTNFEPLETVLICCFTAFITDTLYHKIGKVYFFTIAKFIAILTITITLLIAAFNFSYTEYINELSYVIVTIMSIIYIVLRYRAFNGLMSTDLFASAILLLMVLARVAGIASNVILISLGVYYIVHGSQKLTLTKLNFGMTLIVSIIGIRFFDSNLDLLGRGIVFILIGFVFIGTNLYITRKRKDMLK